MSQKLLPKDAPYADACHNALVRDPGRHPDGRYPHIHPSEPSYIWSEAGSNLDVKSDADPYSWFGWRGTHQATHRHLSHALEQNGHTWCSYQEDIDLKKNADGQITNRHTAKPKWIVPLSSNSDTSPAYTNRYNKSHNTAMRPNTIHRCSLIIPEIRHSPAYDEHTMIEIWMDETAGGDDFQHTIPDILISPQAHANVDGKPFASQVNLTHSSGLKTMAEIFGTPEYRHASDAVTRDYSSMLKPGALPRDINPAPK